MKKVELNGKDKIVHQITKANASQSVMFKHIGLGATIKAEVIRDVDSDEKLYNAMNIAMLNEAQDKIEHLITGRSLKQFKLVNVDINGSPVPVIEQAKIDLAYGGEIALLQNETVDITLSSLGELPQSSMFTFEGFGVSKGLYDVKDKTFKTDETQEAVDLANTQFLVFNPDNLPTEIDFRVNGQKVTRTSEALKLEQIDKYQVVGYDVDGNAVFGYSKALVLDVRGFESVYLENEGINRQDIKYYQISTPY